MSTDNLHDLIEGQTNTGNVGILFQSEYRKMLARKASKIKGVLSNTQKLTLELLEQEVQRLSRKRHKSKQDIKRIIEINNSLNKANPPSIEIANIAYSKGLSEKDLIHEFKRLSTLAQAALNRRGVQSSAEGRTRVLSVSSGAGDTIQEE